MGVLDSLAKAVLRDVDQTTICSIQEKFPPQLRHGDMALRYIGFKKKTHIRNVSGHHVYAIISSTPTVNLSAVTVNKIGSLQFEHKGETLCQEINISDGVDKKIYLETYRYYLTIFMRHNDKWKILYRNKICSARNNITILPRHTFEAKDIKLVQEVQE